MARRYKKAGSWEGSPHFRWTKMVKGTRLRITCAELPLSRELWTEADSYSLALKAMEKKAAELVANDPMTKAVARIQDFQALAQRHGLTEIAKDLGTYANDVKQKKVTEVNISSNDWNKLTTLKDIEAVASPDPAARAKTCGYLVELYLKERKQRVEAAGANAQDYFNTVRFLDHFKKVIGEATDLESITVAHLKQWFNYCKTKETDRRNDDKGEAGWSGTYAEKTFKKGRIFLQWCYDCEYIDRLPRKMNLSEFRFDTVLGDPVPMEPKEVKSWLPKVTNGTYKATFLLMLNCGMTQIDVSKLRKDQIDFKKGTLTRRRTKMEGSSKGYYVTYTLWEETIAALKSALSLHPVLALTTENQTPLVIKKIGQIKDAVTNYWKWFRKKHKVKKSPKTIRKAGATLVKARFDAETRELWLANTPKSVGDKHYSRSVVLPKEVTDYLHEQYLGA